MSNYRFEMTPEEFDNYIIRAKLEERERITNVLKEARESKPCQCDDCGDHVWQQAIELIKGKENV